jgi:N-acetylneuraminate synthase
MDTLAERFRLPVGYSDHTRGIAVALAAAARGARVIEKHFTLDRSRPGPDHAASLEPAELAALVRGVREVEACLGSPEKALNPVERDNARVARKGLVAACTIRKGELFTAANLSVKRPAAGRPPMDYWELLGKAADRDYARDDVILA